MWKAVWSLTFSGEQDLSRVPNVCSAVAATAVAFTTAPFMYCLDFFFISAIHAFFCALFCGKKRLILFAGHQQRD